jgi:hypothetical protein
MYYGTPPIVTNGLVLNLDAQSPQSIPLDPTINFYNSSENISVFPWQTNNGNTVTSSAVTAPYGSGPTNLFTNTAAFSSIFQERTLYQGTYNISWHIKYINQRYYNIVYEGTYGVARFDILNGVVDTFYNGPNLTRISAASITPAPNGYYRINATLNVTESVINFARINLWPGVWSSNNYSGSQAYVWGAQLSRTSYATPYVSSSSTVLGARTSWQDLSGNNNIATLRSSSISGSIPVFPAANNRVLDFNGTSSYASISPISFNPVGTSDFTISAWIKLNAKPITNPRIVSLGSDANNYFNLGTYGGNSPETYDTFWFEVKKAGTFYGGFFDASRKYETNKWYNLVGTSINSTNSMSFYINGISVTGVNVNGGAPNTFNTMFIGTNTTSSVEVVNGSISQVQMYNRALSQAEITQNYNALKSRFGLQ